MNFITYKEKLFVLLLIIVLLSCISCKKGMIKNEVLNDGWINSSKFVVSSIGYPKTSSETSEYYKSAYDAALNLAKIKIENAFMKEVPLGINTNDIVYIIDKYSKVLSSQYIDKRYIEMTVAVEKNNILNILRSGNLSSLIE